MDLDEGLKYQAEIIKIEKMFQEIKELGMDTTLPETIVNNIQNQLQKEKEEVKQKILNSQYSTESIQNFFQENYYAPYYRKALQNLLVLEEGLVQEYDIYVRMNNTLNFIENNLENIEVNQLDQLISMMKTTLKDLKESTKLDHDEERRLIEKTYSLIYQLIKLELLFQEKSSLLDTVLRNDTDIQNIEEILLAEVASLDPKQPNTKAILKKIKDLKPKGLMNIYLKESTYLDLELLKLLAPVNNESFIKRKKETLKKNAKLLKQQLNSLATLTEEKEDLNRKLEDHHQIQKEYKKDIIKYGSYITGMSSLILATFLTAKAIDNKASFEKNYYAKTTTYDVNKDKTTTTEDYQTDAESHIYLKKYFPYHERDNYYGYIREIYTYDISTLDYADLKDYANINLEEFPFTISTHTPLSPSDMYQEPYITIERKEVDTENFIMKKDDALSTVIYGVFIIPIMMEGTFLVILGFMKQFGDSWIVMLKRALEDYNWEKITIDELEQQLEELESTFHSQNQTLQQLKSHLEQEYHQLPINLKQDQELIKIKKKKTEKLKLEQELESNRTSHEKEIEEYIRRGNRFLELLSDESPHNFSKKYTLKK